MANAREHGKGRAGVAPCTDSGCRCHEFDGRDFESLTSVTGAKPRVVPVEKQWRPSDRMAS